MSKSAGTQTTQTLTEPWKVQQPYITKGFERADELFNANTPNYYSGNTYDGTCVDTNTNLECDCDDGGDCVNISYMCTPPEYWTDSECTPSCNYDEAATRHDWICDYSSCYGCIDSVEGVCVQGINCDNNNECIGDFLCGVNNCNFIVVFKILNVDIM